MPGVPALCTGDRSIHVSGWGWGAGVATLTPLLGSRAPSSGATGWGWGDPEGHPPAPPRTHQRWIFQPPAPGPHLSERRARVSVATLGLESSCKGVPGFFFFFFSKLSFYLGWPLLGKMGGRGCRAAILARCGAWPSQGVGTFPGCTAAGFGAPRRAHSPRLPRVPAAPRRGAVPAQLLSARPPRAALKPELEGAGRAAAGAAGPRRHWRGAGRWLAREGRAGRGGAPGARGRGGPSLPARSSRRRSEAALSRQRDLSASSFSPELFFQGEASGNRPSWMDGYGERGRTSSPGILADSRLPPLQLPRR